MKLLNRARDYVAERILPNTIYNIGYRERLASLLSSQDQYTIVLMTDGKKEEEMAYLTFQNGDERGTPGVLFEGKAPELGDDLKLDLFLPGLACYVPYGVHNLPVREVKSSLGMLEVIIHIEDMQRREEA